MKGFKPTGHGPKMGHSFGPKHGFTHSGTNKQSVKGYSRAVPKVATKTKFASGGMVTTPQAAGDSAVIKRNNPVTGFDADHGGKGPLRPGFNHGGKACYAEGGKVNSVGAAIKMVKQLMAQGNSSEAATQKAARRFGVSPTQVTKPEAPKRGGSDPQMLARGGLSQRTAPGPIKTAAARFQSAGPIKAAPIAPVAAPTMSNHGYGSFRRGALFG